MKLDHKPIVVVGGCNFDIYATSAEQLLEADSNPGAVTTSPGGVGRNIAENLARLQHPTIMLSALGDDAFSDAIRKNAAEAGLDLSHCLVLPHLSTSVYVCINKPDGDIALAVSDMGICDRITPDYLSDCSQVLAEADCVVADANLTGEALAHLAEHYGAKLFIDCVSAVKVMKLSPILPHLYCIKANRSEASALTGVAIRSSEDARKAAAVLHQAGVKLVIITLSENGAYLSDGATEITMPLMPGETLNTSGCGDAFFAGLVSAHTCHTDVKKLLRSGLAMSRLCAASNGAVSSLITPQLLEQTLNRYQGGAWQ